MSFRDVAAADVVHHGVICLGDYGHRPGIVFLKVLSVLVDHPAHRGVVNDADGMRISETDGPTK